MKKMMFVMGALGVLATSGVAAAEVVSENWQVKGEGAYASVYGGDDCTSYGFDFGGNEQTVHQVGGQPVESKEVWAGVWISNWCEGTETYGWANVNDPSFSASLSSASGSISFQADRYGVAYNPDTDAYEWTYLGSVPVTASLSWTGTGDSQKGMNSSMGRYGKSTSRNRWMGTFRDASVSAAITIDGDALEAAFVYGSVGKYASGWSAISHY